MSRNKMGQQNSFRNKYCNAGYIFAIFRGGAFVSECCMAAALMFNTAVL